MSCNRLPNRCAAQIVVFEHDARRYRATYGFFADGPSWRDFFRRWQGRQHSPAACRRRRRARKFVAAKWRGARHDQAVDFRTDRIALQIWLCGEVVE